MTRTESFQIAHCSQTARLGRNYDYNFKSSRRRVLELLKKNLFTFIRKHSRYHSITEVQGMCTAYMG